MVISLLGVNVKGGGRYAGDTADACVPMPAMT